MKSFLSDNCSQVADEVLSALSEANCGDTPPYGKDPWSSALQQICCDFFESQVHVFPVHSGSAGNSIALSCCVAAGETVLCHRNAHVYAAEQAALEMFSGARLTPVDSPHGKIQCRDLSQQVHQLRSRGDFQIRPRAISVSQSTELGTLYTPQELAELGETCAVNQMLMHVDGARFFHALGSSGGSPAEMTWKAGVALLSLGFTKCGGMDTDAVVMFDDVVGGSGFDPLQLALAISRQQRRSGHTSAKMRFASVQVSAILTSGVWRRIAQHCRSMACSLESIFHRYTGLQICEPVLTNHVIVAMPDAIANELRRLGWHFLNWTIAGPTARRFVTGPGTSAVTLSEFAQDLALAVSF